MMQGYILFVQKQKNEDVIVRILSQTHVMTLYRFYGARHSIIHIGRKIDFIKEHNGIFLPKLRNVIHLGFPWERQAHRLYVWQQFCALLHRYLRDISSIDARYFSILNAGAQALSRQNPKRVALEMYAQMLLFEGRMPHISRCHICAMPITPQHSLDSNASNLPPHARHLTSANDVKDASYNALYAVRQDNRACASSTIALLQGFFCAHTYCAKAPILSYTKLASYVNSASTIDLDDDEVERAYQVLLLGL